MTEIAREAKRFVNQIFFIWWPSYRVVITNVFSFEVSLTVTNCHLLQMTATHTLSNREMGCHFC